METERASKGILGSRPVFGSYLETCGNLVASEMRAYHCYCENNGTSTWLEIQYLILNLPFLVNVFFNPVLFSLVICKHKVIGLTGITGLFI